MTSHRTPPAQVRRWTEWAAAGCLVLLVPLVLLVGFPAAAAAHGGVLKSSNPADGAAVADLSRIELRFSTPVLAEYSQFVLTDSTGAVTSLEPTFTPNSRAVTLTAGAGLAAEGYRLAYRVVSDDGHPATGSIGFTVGDTTVPPPPRPSPAAPSQPGLLSADRFATDRALPWVLAGTATLIAAGFVYLLSRSRWASPEKGAR